MSKGKPAPTPEEILQGLSPRLAGELANLVGQTLDELSATFELFPWGDRATLAAYGLIELHTPQPGAMRGRVKKVLPLCIEVIDIAPFRG